ncbi:MAG: single-strand binding protein [Candidatus Angelobacter sp.]|jgi:single-strand DNA-binding protein|nr:single-strand binding protein [Candidatus Angelobacter sp.]
MAKSVNKVILIGTLGKDPELKYTPQGTAVTKFSMATNESFKDKQSGEWKERTEWHNIVCWQRTAEVAAEYLKKGGKVYIEGRLTTRSWDDKDSGQKRYMTEVVANDLVLLGNKGGAGSSSDGESGGGRKSSGSGFDQRPAAEDNFAQSTEITDEDIPF